jgi:hypothetical protein
VYKSAAQPVGSTRTNYAGYIEVKVRTGARKKNWAFEHRLVWEQANGPLPEGAFIHHLNGAKSDNRLENLHLVLSNSEHHREHHAEENRERGRHVGLWNRGKPKPPEQRAKIAAANRGKPKSPEHRAKLSAALAGRSWAEQGRR